MHGQNHFKFILLMNKENCALKLVDEIILYYDARSKKHQTMYMYLKAMHICVKQNNKLMYNT